MRHEPAHHPAHDTGFGEPQLDGRIAPRSVLIAVCLVILPATAVLWAMSLLF